MIPCLRIADTVPLRGVVPLCTDGYIGRGGRCRQWGGNRPRFQLGPHALPVSVESADVDCVRDSRAEVRNGVAQLVRSKVDGAVAHRGLTDLKRRAQLATEEIRFVLYTQHRVFTAGTALAPQCAGMVFYHILAAFSHTLGKNDWLAVALCCR